MAFALHVCISGGKEVWVNWYGVWICEKPCASGSVLKADGVEWVGLVFGEILQQNVTSYSVPVNQNAVSTK